MAHLCRMIPEVERDIWPVASLSSKTTSLSHRMDHGRLPPLDGQTLATYKDSTRS